MRFRCRMLGLPLVWIGSSAFCADAAADAVRRLLSEYSQAYFQVTCLDEPSIRKFTYRLPLREGKSGELSILVDAYLSALYPELSPAGPLLVDHQLALKVPRLERVRLVLSDGGDPVLSAFELDLGSEGRMSWLATGEKRGVVESSLPEFEMHREMVCASSVVKTNCPFVIGSN